MLKQKVSWNTIKEKYLEFHKLPEFTENMAIDIDFGYWLVNEALSEWQDSTETAKQHDSKALHKADISNCLVKSNYIEKSHEILNKYSKSLSSVVKLAIVESWQDGFEKAIKYISENNC